MKTHSNINTVELYNELIEYKSSVITNIKKKIDWEKDLYIVVDKEKNTISYLYKDDYNSSNHIILTKIESLRKLLFDSMKLLIKQQEYLQSVPTKRKKNIDNLWEMIKM